MKLFQIAAGNGGAVHRSGCPLLYFPAGLFHGCFQSNLSCIQKLVQDGGFPDVAVGNERLVP